MKTNVWNEAPVVHERARYCPTCCLTFPRKILNFNDNLNNSIMIKSQDQEKLINFTSPLTQLIDNAIISTQALCTIIKKTRSISVSSDDDDEDGSDNDADQSYVNNDNIAQDNEILDISLNSNS